MKEIKQLIKNLLLIEWRERYALNGILLYVFSSIFTVSLSVKMLNLPTWNAVFWVLILFSSINAIAKSFIAESKGKMLYFHGLILPEHLILAKSIYSAILNLVLSFIALLFYSIVLGNPIHSLGFYCLILVLASIGFAFTFTMISAIAQKSGNGNLLMPILSFPIIIPFLLLLIKSSKKAMDGIDVSLIYTDLLLLVAMNLLVAALAYVLFPFLWKE
jgi:heme exporter protein B